MKNHVSKKLTLSIVIPVFNEESYLKACLDSIAAQARPADEVIVVDNNSTDRTLEIATKYGFVKVIHEAKQGVIFARDRGLSAAKSDIIARIDGDSILPSDWSLEILRAFEDAYVSAATGPVNYYDMPLPHANHWINHVMCLYTKRMAPNSPFLYGTNMAIRRDVWHALKPDLCHRNDIHEDIDLAIHLGRSGHFVHYSRSLLAGASGRRYNDRPRKFFAYISMFSRVYRHHSLFNVSMYLSMFLWCLGYTLIHPMRRLWSGLYRATGTSYPLSTKARKNPMSADL